MMIDSKKRNPLGFRNLALALPIALGVSAGFAIALPLTADAATSTPNSKVSSKQPSKSRSPKQAKAKDKSNDTRATKKSTIVRKKITKQSPANFVGQRAQKVLSALKSRPQLPTVVTASSSVQEIEIPAQKAAWLSGIYSRNMIEASWATEMLADKRILFEALQRELGDRAANYYPKTLGLREFLFKHALVDASGKISAEGDQIEAALHEEFPSGFMVRPAVGVAPSETGRGLYPDTDQFIVTLLTPGNPIYAPAHMAQAVKSHILNEVASGEAVVLQENFIIAADARKPLKNRIFHEVRIHTYENRVIEGAVPERWVQTNLLGTADIRRAETFVAEFLRLLPGGMLNRQAWGVDVAVMDNGELRIIDVVTNRGKKAAWSGYLDQPRVIGAYSRHFEKHYGLRFAGLSGTLIRNGFANYFPYWEKRIDKARPGWSKALSYIPPMP